jgi:DNA-directed RNA polymerase specialized sigma24 family protein
MKTVTYSDPYEKETVVLRVKDKEIGRLEGTMEFLSEDTRKTQNLERKERYHTECSLDALDFEGSIYASDEDVEEDFLRSEEERIIDDWLRSRLTLVQYRRFKYHMDGLSLRDIAELEGTDYKTVRESVESAKKKLQKVFRDTPSETPL